MYCMQSIKYSTLFYKYDITSIHYINACYLFPVPTSNKSRYFVGYIEITPCGSAMLLVTSVLLRHRM